jgi:CotS family spore coat protein
MEDLGFLDLKERNSIYKVLERYNLNVLDIQKFESRYKIATKDNYYWLYALKSGRDDIINNDSIGQELIKNKFSYFQNYIRTKYHELYIRSNKTIYYLTECIEGEACNIRSFDEAAKAVKFLASFHTVSYKINNDSQRLKKNRQNWIYIFNKNLSDFEKYKILIEKKRIRNSFDSIFYQQIDYYYKIGMLSLDLLSKYDYYNTLHKGDTNYTLCLDGLNRKNFIKTNGLYYLTSLDPVIIDYYVNDLNKYIKSIMNKTDFAWDFIKAKGLIEAYSDIKKLSKQDLGILLALIIFPYRFWKLGKKRYVTRKNWDENKYMNKLQKITKYQEKQEKFINDFFNYLSEI